MDRVERVERTGSIVGTISGSDDALAGSGSVADTLTIDAAARADARTALNAARRAAGGRATFLDAGPGHLAQPIDSLIFVDGPSRAPGVVSVASTRETWAAAVMGPSGTCYLAALRSRRRRDLRHRRRVHRRRGVGRPRRLLVIVPRVFACSGFARFPHLPYTPVP